MPKEQKKRGRREAKKREAEREVEMKDAPKEEEIIAIAPEETGEFGGDGYCE